MTQPLFKLKKQSPSTSYYTLAFGLAHNDLAAVKLAIKSGAKLSNLLIKSDNYYADKPDYIGAADYARSQEVSNEIMNYVVSLSPVTPAQQKKLVIRAISDESTSEADLINTLKKYVNKGNVNKISEVSRGYKEWHPARSINLLSLACSHSNVVAVKELLKLGANPNQFNSPSKGYAAMHPIEYLSSSRKGTKGDALAIISEFLQYGLKLNTYLKGHNRDNTLWCYLLENFKSQEIQAFIKLQTPVDFKSLALLGGNKTLAKTWRKHGGSFKNYPLLQDIEQHEGKEVILSTSNAHNFKGFFREKSIKAALRKRYRVSSSNFVKMFTEELFVDQGNSVKICYNPIIKGDILAQLFINRDQPNPDTFLKCFEEVKNIEVIFQNRYGRRDVVKQMTSFLTEHFNDAQIKQLIAPEKAEDLEYCEDLDDTVNMAKSFQKEISLRLKETPFKQINTIKKLHDFIMTEIETLDQANFSLGQEGHFPQLKKLAQVQLPESYGLKLAEDNHELIRWGASMGHCVGGGHYAKQAQEGRIILIAITKDGEPKYCVEIRNKVIRQVQGPSRSKPAKDVMLAFTNGLKTLNLLNTK